MEYRQSITSDHFEHKMAVYLDCAIRDYYNAGGTFKQESKEKISASIYAAPILLVKDSFHKSDKELILNALNDSLTNHFSNLILSSTPSVEIKEKKILDEDFDEYIAAGKNLGCDYVLIRVLRSKKIRDAPLGDRQVTLEEIILDKNGFPLSMQTSGSSTKELTIFEAALAAQETLNERLKIFFTGK